MRIPILKLWEKTTSRGQMTKVIEECNEARNAWIATMNYSLSSNREELRGELIDIIQATYGLLHKISTKKDIEHAFDLHVEKLKNRDLEWDEEITGEVRGKTNEEEYFYMAQKDGTFEKALGTRVNLMDRVMFATLLPNGSTGYTDAKTGIMISKNDTEMLEAARENAATWWETLRLFEKINPSPWVEK